MIFTFVGFLAFFIEMEMARVGVICLVMLGETNVVLGSCFCIRIFRVINIIVTVIILSSWICMILDIDNFTNDLIFLEFIPKTKALTHMLILILMIIMFFIEISLNILSNDQHTQIRRTVHVIIIFDSLT